MDLPLYQLSDLLDCACSNNFHLGEYNQLSRELSQSTAKRESGHWDSLASLQHDIYRLRVLYQKFYPSGGSEKRLDFTCLCPAKKITLPPATEITVSQLKKRKPKKEAAKRSYGFLNITFSFDGRRNSTSNVSPSLDDADMELWKRREKVDLPRMTPKKSESAKKKGKESSEHDNKCLLHFFKVFLYSDGPTFLFSLLSRTAGIICGRGTAGTPPQNSSAKKSSRPSSTSIYSSTSSSTSTSSLTSPTLGPSPSPTPDPLSPIDSTVCSPSPSPTPYSPENVQIASSSSPSEFLSPPRKGTRSTTPSSSGDLSSDSTRSSTPYPDQSTTPSSFLSPIPSSSYASTVTSTRSNSPTLTNNQSLQSLSPTPIVNLFPNFSISSPDVLIMPTRPHAFSAPPPPLVDIPQSTSSPQLISRPTPVKSLFGSPGHSSPVRKVTKDLVSPQARASLSSSPSESRGKELARLALEYTLRLLWQCQEIIESDLLETCRGHINISKKDDEVTSMEIDENHSTPKKRKHISILTEEQSSSVWSLKEAAKTDKRWWIKQLFYKVLFAVSSRLSRVKMVNILFDMMFGQFKNHQSMLEWSGNPLAKSLDAFGIRLDRKKRPSIATYIKKQIKELRVLPAILFCVSYTDVKEQEKTLEDLNVIIISSPANAEMILATQGWVRWFLPLLMGKKARLIQDKEEPDLPSLAMPRSRPPSPQMLRNISYARLIADMGIVETPDDNEDLPVVKSVLRLGINLVVCVIHHRFTHGVGGISYASRDSTVFSSAATPNNVQRVISAARNMFSGPNQQIAISKNLPMTPRVTVMRNPPGKDSAYPIRISVTATDDTAPLPSPRLAPGHHKFNSSSFRGVCISPFIKDVVVGDLKDPIVPPPRDSPRAGVRLGSMPVKRKKFNEDPNIPVPFAATTEIKTLILDMVDNIQAIIGWNLRAIHLVRTLLRALITKISSNVDYFKHNFRHVSWLGLFEILDICEEFIFYTCEPIEAFKKDREEERESTGELGIYMEEDGQCPDETLAHRICLLFEKLPMDGGAAGVIRARDSQKISSYKERVIKEHEFWMNTLNFFAFIRQGTVKETAKQWEMRIQEERAKARKRQGKSEVYIEDPEKFLLDFAKSIYERHHKKKARIRNLLGKVRTNDRHVNLICKDLQEIVAKARAQRFIATQFHSDHRRKVRTPTEASSPPTHHRRRPLYNEQPHQPQLDPLIENPRNPLENSDNPLDMKNTLDNDRIPVGISEDILGVGAIITVNEINFEPMKSPKEGRQNETKRRKMGVVLTGGGPGALISRKHRRKHNMSLSSILDNFFGSNNNSHSNQIVSISPPLFDLDTTTVASPYSSTSPYSSPGSTSPRAASSPRGRKPNPPLLKVNTNLASTNPSSPRGRSGPSSPRSRLPFSRQQSNSEPPSRSSLPSSPRKRQMVIFEAHGGIFTSDANANGSRIRTSSEEPVSSTVLYSSNNNNSSSSTTGSNSAPSSLIMTNQVSSPYSRSSPHNLDHHDILRSKSLSPSRSPELFFSPPPSTSLPQSGSSSPYYSPSLHPSSDGHIPLLDLSASNPSSPQSSPSTSTSTTPTLHYRSNLSLTVIP